MNDLLIVHFLYGSRPKRGSGNTEKVPGGLLGGHIWLQAHDYVFGFESADKSKIHVFPRKKFSAVFTRDHVSAWLKNTSGKKITSVAIPLEAEALNKIKEILESYHRKLPYDYAVFGMRCAASTFQILSFAGLFPFASDLISILKNPYPRILRRKLLKFAAENNYKVIRKKGKDDRIWEKE
jgi:hypothetical protein